MAESTTDLFCIACGYNQRGIIADRCPECGCAYADAPPSPVRLPWAHRRHWGLVRAYWRTVWLVIFRYKTLCAESEFPVSYSDARRFWLMTAMVAYFPWLVATALLYWMGESAGGKAWQNSTIYQMMFIPVYTRIWPAVPIHIGIICFLLAATGVPSYFCHPKRLTLEEQDRAISLSYYACAPLALMPILTLTLILSTMTLSGLIVNSSARIHVMPAVLAIMMSLILPVFWAVRTGWIVSTLTRRGWLSREIIATALFVIWLVLGILCLVIVPLSVQYLCMLIYSFF